MHIGLIAHMSPSHIAGMASLGAQLHNRGHRVTLFQVPDIEPAARRAGLEFYAIGKRQYPLGTVRKLDERFSRLRGVMGVHYAMRRAAEYTEIFFQEAPAVINDMRIDALVVDEVEAYGAAIAEHLELPFVHITMALPLKPDEFIPPYFTEWSYRTDRIGRFRNRLGYHAFRYLVGPVINRVDAQRRAWGLSRMQDRRSLHARLATITQLPACLDFPRILPRFYYTGPFALKAARAEIAFPWEKLDGRPIVYASLGTLVGRARTFRIIAAACSGLDVQLVLSLGGGAVKPESLPGLPGNPIVVSYAPQLELIKRAALVITHAGLNTTLESLSHGVPMVAIPFTHDQPGVAARVVWRGAGELVSPRSLSVRKLRAAIQLVLSQPGFRQSARWLQAEIKTQDGLRQAGDIVERTFNCEGSRSVTRRVANHGDIS